MDSVLVTIATSVLTGVISSLGTIAAIRVELNWLRRDVDQLRAHVDALRNGTPRAD